MSLTEVYLGPDASNTFRTDVVYKGGFRLGENKLEVDLYFRF